MTEKKETNYKKEQKKYDFYLQGNDMREKRYIEEIFTDKKGISYRFDRNGTIYKIKSEN